jgi:hypothetical protein
LKALYNGKLSKLTKWVYVRTKWVYVRMGLIKRAPLFKRLNEEIVNLKIMLDYDRMGFFFL